MFSGAAVTNPASGTLAGLSEQQKRNVLKGVTDRYGGSRPQQPHPPPRPQEDPKAVYRVPVDDSPAKGPADALVTVVESSEFECPFCKRVLPTLKQIEEAYRGKVRFVFKHNPLPFHPRRSRRRWPPRRPAPRAARPSSGPCTTSSSRWRRRWTGPTSRRPPRSWGWTSPPSAAPWTATSTRPASSGTRR